MQRVNGFLRDFGKLSAALKQLRRRFNFSTLKIKISSETQLSQHIAEVVFDIFVSVARMQKMTAKRFLLKIACLMTESFRAAS